jgi:FkbM family methyltransferase
MSDSAALRVYDFGMNKAEDTDYYLAKGFSVVAVEANPAMCAAAEERFAAARSEGRLTVVNRAVGEQPGTLPFFVCNEVSARSTASRSLVEFWRGKGETFREIAVEFTTADAIIGQHGAPYYVKVDIEGHDLVCLRQIQRAGKFPQFLSFEVDFANYRDCLEVCRAMGYRRFCLVDQKSVAEAKVPKPAREGNDVAYQFVLGHTGPFGNDLPGPWLTHEAVLRQCASIRNQFRTGSVLRRLAPTKGLRRAADQALAGALPATQTWYDIHAAF